MSEHLQFTPISPGTSPLSGPPAAVETAGLPSLVDIFAALLDGLETKPGGAAATLSEGLVSAGVKGMALLPTLQIALVPPTGVSEPAQAVIPGPEAPAPYAPVREPVVAEEVAVDPKVVLADLADALVALDTALETGQQPEPALLARVDKAIDALAELLDLPADDKPRLAESLGAIAGLAATVFAPVLAPIVAAAVPVLAGAVDAATPDIQQAPVVAKTAEKIADIAARLEPADAPLAKRLAELGEKLGSGKVAPDLVAKLGLSVDAPADSELDAAIQALIVEKPPAPRVMPAQALATPALQLPAETVLGPRTAGNAPIVDEPAPIDLDVEIDIDVEIAKPVPTQATTPEKPRADTGQNTTPAPSAPPPAATAETRADPAATVQTTSSPVQLLPAATAHAAVKALHAAYQTPQLNLPQLAFEMVRQAQGGNSRFQIRLDPPELGRIDVRMDVDTGGNLNARLTVERSETLDLLQRDQRALERALAQAGIDTGKTNLEFSLKQNPFERPQGSPFAEAFPGGNGPADPMVEAAEVSTVTLYRGAASAGGVNIIV